jgi:pyruvate/2-oxoglutarate dehydrogenase complex dihydrolipoamide acyltransferase (E2) component
LHLLAATTKRLRGQALAGTLAQTDLARGTFTISNLGMLGVESVMAVITPPDAARFASNAPGRMKRFARVSTSCAAC